MSFDQIIVLIIILAVLFYGRIFFRGVSYTANDREFSQAGVLIDYGKGTISIRGKTFKVSQVTGIRWEATTSSYKHGNSIAKTVIIDLDDLSTPNRHIMFLSKDHARKFVQRICVALRKAGGPSFV